MPVAIEPVDLAFALLKSARVSTAGAIRARYHGTPRRVLFKASSVDLSQDARALRVKEKVIAIVSVRQSTNGAEQRKSSETIPGCTRCMRLGHSRHYLRHGREGRGTLLRRSTMLDECARGLGTKKSAVARRSFPGCRETVELDCVPVLYRARLQSGCGKTHVLCQGTTLEVAEKLMFCVRARL
jgi:hypothetical protein